jgi:hypothetical protein
MMPAMNVVRRARTFLIAASTLAVAVVAGAQEIRVGGLEGNSAVFAGATAMTLIDWSRPASGNGEVNTASVAWTAATAPCDGIFYVRFYAIPSNALVAVMTAERGPFRAVNGINTVALEPPVPVTPEIYIGIRRNEGVADCGMPYGSFTRDSGRTLLTTTDFKGGPLTGVSPAPNFRLLAQASNTPSVRVSTLPVVGSGPGNFGSFFRTSLTLSNPGALEIRGKLRLRPNGRPGSDGDPLFDFVIPGNGTLNYADIIQAMGQSGLGSLDILTTASFTPTATARVFNDAGPLLGTSGLAEEAIPAATAYLSLSNVFIPEDLTNFRLNIGIRTFTSGDLNVEIYDAAGVRQTSFVKHYDPNFFAQISASDFVGGAALPPGGKVVVSAFGPQFIVYGAVTDNRTNDPSMRIGTD